MSELTSVSSYALLELVACQWYPWIEWPLIEKGRRRPLGFDWKIWFDSLEVELIYAKAVISNLEALEGQERSSSVLAVRG